MAVRNLVEAEVRSALSRGTTSHTGLELTLVVFAGDPRLGMGQVTESWGRFGCSRFSLGNIKDLRCALAYIT